MILKVIFPIVLVLLLTVFYFDRTYWRNGRSWKRAVGWTLAIFSLYATIFMAARRDYFPDDFTLLFRYMDLLFVLIVPASLFALCSFIGRRLKRQRQGEWTGLGLALVVALFYLYGMYVGSRKMEVTQVSFAHKDVPKAFDGYKIVQLSDVHVGSLNGSRQELLRECVERINNEHADLVVFTGDLQNKRADEIEPHRQLLSSIKAKDGVVAVLGNHDYAEYMSGTKAEKDSCVQLTVRAIEQLGWTLLRNEHLVIRRGNDSIVVAGMENDGEGRFPQLGDIKKTLEGVGEGAFILMLEHDPTSWHRKIVPYSHAQLTLSGHTHGGQLSLFGWSPVSFVYSEYNGTYHNGRHSLYVSKGLGGVLPFRLGATGEIVVITLNSKP